MAGWLGTGESLIPNWTFQKWTFPNSFFLFEPEFQSSSSSRTDPRLEEVTIFLHAKFVIIHTLEITNLVMSIFEMSNL